MTRQLSEKAHALDAEARSLFARVQGAFEALNNCSRDGKVYWPNPSTDILLHDIKQFMYEPVGVPPIAPEMLAKIMGDA